MSTLTLPMSPAQRFSGLSNDEQQILDQADHFAQRELYPLAPRMDKDEWWPPDVFAQIGATGYFGIPVPEAYGGSGLDLFASGLVVQAFSRWNHALALSWVAHENLCLYNIFRNASEAQRQRYLPGLCSGKAIGAQVALPFGLLRGWCGAEGRMHTLGIFKLTRQRGCQIMAVDMLTRSNVPCRHANRQTILGDDIPGRMGAQGELVALADGLT